MSACEQGCGRRATVYALDPLPGGWGGRYCAECTLALGFTAVDRLREPVEPDSACAQLFFYGTLMSSGSRGHVLRHAAEKVADATVRGDLFDVNGGIFPAMLPGDGLVHGEVWKVRPGWLNEALRTTDSIEGYQPDRPEWSMYVRREVPLLAPSDAEDGTAWTYFWNGRATSLTRAIPDGRWTARPYTPEAAMVSRGRS